MSGPQTHAHKSDFWASPEKEKQIDRLLLSFSFWKEKLHSNEPYIFKIALKNSEPWRTTGLNVKTILQTVYTYGFISIFGRKFMETPTLF